MIRTPQRIKMIKISEISPNPYQIRRSFDRKELNALADSIKQVGILTPVILRGALGGYEVICGQRRVRAATIAGLKEVPAIIIRAGDLQCALLSLTENLHRKNLTGCEEAEGYFNMMAYHGVKKDKLCSMLASENSKIRDKTRILCLSEEVRYKIEENAIPERMVQELIKLRDEEKQLECIEKIANEELNYKGICDEVRQFLREMTRKRAERERNITSSFAKNVPLYINTVKRTVQLLKNSGARVELYQTDGEDSVEFTIKVTK